MARSENHFEEQSERPKMQKNAKGGFLILCTVLSAIYLLFSLTLSAHASPPTSPYTPGQTLNPTCAPTSTNCTVYPPLFSTSTLPMGGILFMNDTSGTVTAATSTLYWNASSSQFQVGQTPVANATGSLLLLGPNSIIGGNVSGTLIGTNLTTTTFQNGTFMNFQINSSTKFMVNASGSITIGTGTPAANALLTIATGTPIFTVANNGLVTIPDLGGGLAIGTSTLFGTTSTLTVCAQSNCTTPTTASGTNTVAYFASTAGTTTSTSIVARGVITSGLTDVGEYIPVVGGDADYGQGDVVTPANSSTVAFQETTEAYDPAVAGVITTTAGLVAGGGQDNPGDTIIALAGRVPVNVTTINGDINVGDELTSSNIPGVAMRATQPGRVIGFALAADSGDPNNPNATSQVMMFVNPHWSLGNLISTQDIASSSWAIMGTSTSQPVLDQFTAYVQAALAKLGVAISNGVATLQGIVANSVTTNELCVQGVCVNGSQLSTMINNNNASSAGEIIPSSSVSSTDTTDTSTIVQVSSSSVVTPPDDDSSDSSSTGSSTQSGGP